MLLWRLIKLYRRGLALLLVVAIATAVGSVVAQRLTVTTGTALARGQTHTQSRELGTAEQVLWTELTTKPPTVPVLVAFLENHQRQVIFASLGEAFAPRGMRFMVTEEQIDELLARPDIPEEIRTLGIFWRGVTKKGVPDEVRAKVVAMAAATPPAPYANRLLGREAHREGRIEDAQRLLEREALSFDDRDEDLHDAIQILRLTDDWEGIGERIANPRLRKRIPPQIRYEYAVHVKNVPMAMRELVASALEPRPLGPLLLASVAALMWFLFSMRMGRAGEKPRLRFPLYFGAFVLGIFSVIPTLLIVGLEESVLHFRERHELMSDAIYFVVGVGLREELSKLLLFLPLLPILRRSGNRLEVLTCGALVGLGFASEENINYLQGGLATALSRFLTANFLHMALTALLALGLFDALREPSRHEGPSFSRTLLMVVGMHGAYDFFLSASELASLSFVAMTVFIILTRMFLAEVRTVTHGPGRPLLPKFTQAVVVVTAASFVYASARVGPVGAAFVLAQGLLGMLFIVVMFVQEMRKMR